ncbi:TPA: hypothetical protein ACG06B_004323 [Pseudomonas aeruginosa]
MTNANECTCPSGDGSLRHPCPAHIGPFDKLVGSPVHNESEPDLPPLDEHLAQVFETGMALSESVEQAGGDERDLQAEGAQGELLPCPFCGGQAHLTYDDYVHDDLRPMPVVECNACHTWVRAESWNKRAALAQPSPAQAEEERPKIVATLFTPNEKVHDDIGFKAFAVAGDCDKDGGEFYDPEKLMTVAQHERIVKAWIERWKAYIELSAKIAAQRDAANARLHEVATACATAEQERDAALSRVAELEMLLRKLSTNGLMQFSTVDEEMAVQAALGGAPVAQAQQLHNLDKQCRDDVARALGLRPNQERGFAWSYLLASIKSCVKASGDSAQAQHSAGYAEARQCVNCRHIGINDAADYAACHDCRWTGPEPDEDKCPGCAGENCMAAACPECGGRYELVAEAKISTPAAQAGQMPQAWLDVQAERRRQITAEGWTPEHDDEHSHGQIARAAACYALAGSSAPNDGTAALLVSLAWPWDQQWWKPTSARRDLIKAGALILAEIERLDRAAPGKEVGHE